MTQLTHWKKLHNPNYLGAYALEPDKDLIVTIKDVRRECVKGEDGKEEECTVAHFKDSGVKPMVLNSTNCKTITKLYGTPYIEEWSGRSIQIYATTVSAFGEKVEALRIRPKAPVKGNLPELTPDHPKWAGAIQSIKEGSNDLAGIKTHVTLSPENKRLLMGQVNAKG